MTTFTIQKPRNFRIGAALEFYSGFTPGSGMAAASVDDDLTLTFRLDQTFEAVAVTLRENGSSLEGSLSGSDDVSRAKRQVSRMLGLDADGEAWADLRDKDIVVGRLQDEFPGFFTAAKPSPYDAATWSIIAPRMNLRQAAQIKIEMATRLGDPVEVGGTVHHVFPSPAALVGLDRFPGLADEKVTRLRGIGEAALSGMLDVDHLRSLGEVGALAELQSLRGIGPWAASHVYFRGVAPHDALPTAEPRMLHGLADAYGIEVPTVEELYRIAEGWRPFRMWVAVLLSRHLARAGLWNQSRFGSERAAAGRSLASRIRKATRSSAQQKLRPVSVG